MSNKTILLAISELHGISGLIEENLKHHGFNVINIARNDTQQNKFKYPSFLSKVIVFLQKNILLDRNAKHKLKLSLLKKEIANLLPKNNNIDYALFFTANSYNIDFIKFIKDKVNPGGMINYQWDGLDRFKNIYTLLPYFDRKFVFDPSDLGKYDNLLPITSFYFDMDLEPVPEEYDFYYVGSHRDDRYDLIKEFAQFAKDNNYKVNMNVVLPKKKFKLKKPYPENVTILNLIESPLFKENLLSARKSKILLDFVITNHKGLSLRIFEALGHDKKLITTNVEVKKYDFYHPNNIFVLNNNFCELKEFLAKPYIPVEQHIKEKYSFGNWIKYILDIENHQSINLPEK